MRTFILGLTEFLLAAAKRANRHANEQVAWAARNGTGYAEDCAFEESQWTARWADELEDAAYEIEDRISLKGEL